MAVKREHGCEVLGHRAAPYQPWEAQTGWQLRVLIL